MIISAWLRKQGLHSADSLLDRRRRVVVVCEGLQCVYWCWSLSLNHSRLKSYFKLQFGFSVQPWVAEQSTTLSDQLKYLTNKTVHSERLLLCWNRLKYLLITQILTSYLDCAVSLITNILLFLWSQLINIRTFITQESPTFSIIISVLLYGRCLLLPSRYIIYVEEQQSSALPDQQQRNCDSADCWLCCKYMISCWFSW